MLWLPSAKAGLQGCTALPGLHALTGYSTSAFSWKGKKKHGLHLASNTELGTVMANPGRSFEVEPSLVAACEKLVYLLYSRPTIPCINKVRHQLFCAMHWVSSAPASTNQGCLRTVHPSRKLPGSSFASASVQICRA